MSKRKKKVTMASIIDKSMREIHSLGHGLRWEQTPEEKKAYELRQKKEKKFSAKCDAERDKQIKRFNGSAWDKIETCPFWAYEDTYGIESVFLVRKGDEIAIVRPKKRFGTPLECVTPGDLVMRNGMLYDEGVYRKPKNPKWWFKYKLEDVMSHDSDMYGKDEIDFVPDLWQPLPLPTKSP